MQEGGAQTILKRVESATGLLSRAEDVSTDDIAALAQVLDELQRMIAILGSQRVLELPGTLLMNAGVELYNAPRAALRVLTQVKKTKTSDDGQLKAFPRYSLTVTRFVAAKIMGLSLACSKEGESQEKKNMEFMDKCVDVLRSFGRVGMLMLESASVDCEKCEEYLALAKESFSSSMKLWSRIGLSHLTKVKHGLELEDVVDDLWDFCVDHVRVLRLRTEGSDNLSEEFRDILSSLHELKMLAPYKPTYANSLLDLMKSVSDGYRDLAHHNLQVTFAEEALSVGDSLENEEDESFPALITSFKQHLLVNLLQSLCAVGDIERAEACYQLIHANEDPKLLLLMNKLYVDNKQFDKAHNMLQLLFQQDSFDDSILGARTFAQGFSFSDKGLDIYRELADNYGSAEFAINVDIACNLAFVEGKQCEAMEELKRIGGVLLERERSGQAADSRHTLRVRQTIYDALQHAINSNQHEDCLKWADAGLAGASTTHDKAMYMRTISRSWLHLGHDCEAVEWAEKAVATEPSKQSLFALFQVTIETNRGVSERELARIMEQLKARDDFEIKDLLAMGKLANNLGPSRQDIVMLILDELCHTLAQEDNCSTKAYAAIVLQNAAQLAFTRFTQQQQSDNPNSSYGEKFLTYANAFLLQSSRPDIIDHKESFGPSSVFEWFFRMSSLWSPCILSNDTQCIGDNSFEIAKSTEDSRYFIVAANIAERSDELYKDKSSLKQRCQQSLLAAVCSDMKKIETLDKGQLLKLEEVINRIGFIDSGNTTVAPEFKAYLAKTMIAVKLRLFDSNTEAILDLCKTSHHSVHELMEIGELVIYAAKFNEASKVRDSYQSLAQSIFSFGYYKLFFTTPHVLQMLLKEDTVDSTKLCYLLRRLITQAESKTRAHEWLEQLLQFVNNLDLVFSELDLEWFVVKAWNMVTSIIIKFKIHVDY
ncbi:LOW QUALITY PROTEIN: Hypothetical protein PHPALM_12335 [Phytophthora palmivora]|uniref:Protein ZIP4 homolog n=1 Tax=Phytophthora palmivora TaxID=4796 RepID=A0A2P4Y001_9STRA|nr:LOW QUALITY PROTEIN: Hypothetical protein PHPALM_12335 [Phytophthora palmivora]